MLDYFKGHFYTVKFFLKVKGHNWNTFRAAQF